jgi:hypothetical protein
MRVHYEAAAPWARLQGNTATCPYPIGVDAETGAPILCGKPCATPETPAATACVAHAIAWHMRRVQITLAARKAKQAEVAAEGGWHCVAHPEEQILAQIANHNVSQASIAVSYAYVIAQLGDKADWAKINQAIRERWHSPTALVRIKTEAWRYVNEWQSKGRAGLAQEGDR